VGGIDLERIDRQILDQRAVAANGLRDAAGTGGVEGVGVHRIEKLARAGGKADRQGIEPRRRFSVK